MKETLHIYTRVSTMTQQEEGTSLTTQKELGIKRAETLGFEHKIWNEGGASSNYENFENRPVLLELLSEINAGKIHHLWVYNNDRLSRNDITAQTIRIALQKNGVTLYTKDGAYDLNNPHDKMVKGMFDLLAQYDNALRSERTRIGKLNRVKEGRWMGGPAPFGYKIEDKVLTLCQEESGWVRNIYEWYAAGQSIEWIKSELDKNGVLSRRGKLWSQGSVRQILQNTHPLGYYTYTDSKTEEFVECKCPTIVSKTLWDQCQKRRQVINERKGQINRTKRFYLLRDLLYCGHCGKHMAGRIKESKNEYLYYCPHREREWGKSAPANDEKWKRNKGCDMSSSLNINATNHLVLKEIGSSIFLAKIRKQVYEIYHNHMTANNGDSIDSDISLLKKRRKKLEKELEGAIDNVADLRAEKLLKREDERVVDGVIDRMNAHIKETERKIEQVDIDIERRSNKVDPSVIVMDLQNIASEIEELNEKQKMKSFLKSFIEKIMVFYNKDKREHTLVVHMKKSIIGDVHELVLPSKKNRKMTRKTGLVGTPQQNKSITVE